MTSTTQLAKRWKASKAFSATHRSVVGSLTNFTELLYFVQVLSKIHKTGGFNHEMDELAILLQRQWIYTKPTLIKSRHTTRRVVKNGRRVDAKKDADGHCSVCGELWPDRKETLERHKCPPGFLEERM